MVVQRTFGWIQNPGDLNSLIKVVGIFVKDSDTNIFLTKERLPFLLYNKVITQANYDKFISYLKQKEIVVPYSVLKGQGCGAGKRESAMCSGLVQAVIDAQKSKTYFDQQGKKVVIKKPYTDDWTADGYLRWGISTGLLIYNPKTDEVRISKLGEKLLAAKLESKEQRLFLSEALMSYPPVQRVLQVLRKDKSNEGLTKFEIGSCLGFVGEMGFTSIDVGYYLALLAQSDNPEKIRNNIEGDSDKYARTIAGWLVKMGWVKKGKKVVHGFYRGTSYEDNMATYQLTPMGEAMFKGAKGNSSRKRIIKIVHFEMLATKVPNAGYVRKRRACILLCLAKPSSMDDILRYLERQGLTEQAATIIDDIQGLRNIGLEILEPDTNGKYRLNEKIKGLEMPIETEKKEEITTLKERVREKLKMLSHDYLVLIDLAYSGAASASKKNKDAREFEIKTADLFTKELDFNGERLGDADKPDVVIWKGVQGVVIDNKSYKDGFSIGRANEDEMSRYIEQAQSKLPGQPANEWWRIFKKNSVNEYGFLFVTSYLKGKYIDNLKSLSKRRNVNGGAIGIESLLYLAEKMKNGDFLSENLHSLFKNEEIRITL